MEISFHRSLMNACRIDLLIIFHSVILHCKQPQITLLHTIAHTRDYTSQMFFKMGFVIGNQYLWCWIFFYDFLKVVKPSKNFMATWNLIARIAVVFNTRDTCAAPWHLQWFYLSLRKKRPGFHVVFFYFPLDARGLHFENVGFPSCLLIACFEGKF